MQIVVIGTGYGGRLVAPVYRALGAEVCVVSPRDAATIRAACAARPDLVSVHSPPFLHANHVLCALDAGCAVLCDKPFGRDAAEARAMRDRARQVGALTFLNFEFRRQPSRVRLHELVRERMIGAFTHINWTFIGSGLRHQRHRWLFDADQAGGWIGAYGSHAIDTMRWLFDDEVADCGGISRIEMPSHPDQDGVAQAATAEDAFTAWFRMVRGGTVSFDTAYSTPVDLPHRLTLLGSSGSLELVDERSVTLRRPGTADETITFASPSGDPHDSALRPWIKAVLKAVRERCPIAPDFDDGLAVAEAMERLRSGMLHIGGGAAGRDGGDDRRSRDRLMLGHSDPGGPVRADRGGRPPRLPDAERAPQ